MNNYSKFRLCVLTPVFEDFSSLNFLLKDIYKEFKEHVCIVIVDDGSINFNYNIDMKNFIIIKLKKNCGHQKAICIGLCWIYENLNIDIPIVIMDSDGEDSPATIKYLLNSLANESVDIAVAERKSRIESFKFKIFYKIYQRIFWILTGKRITWGNFMALRPAAVKRLVHMDELAIHVAGTVICSRLRYIKCPIRRSARYAGKSKMNFSSLVSHGFKGIMVFAENVQARIALASAFIALFAACGIIYALFLKIVNLASPGWLSSISGMLIIIFLQMISLCLGMLLITGAKKLPQQPIEYYKNYIEDVLKNI